MKSVSPQVYYSLVNIVLFLLPGLLMILCYSVIVAKLHRSAGDHYQLIKFNIN